MTSQVKSRIYFVPGTCSGGSTPATPPAGYQAHQGKYYKGYTQAKNFFAALLECHADGATLAEYQTDDDYSVIEHYLGKSNTIIWQIF